MPYAFNSWHHVCSNDRHTSFRAASYSFPIDTKPGCGLVYCRFMWEYATPLQFAKIFAYTFFLQSLRVQYPNLCVFLAAAPLVSAFRLFYFGTYLPHLPSNAQETMPWEKSHSADDPRPLSFLKCYHFDYHWEHHRWPYAPWWELPVCKRITKTLDAAVPGVQSDGTKKSQLVN